eukprot:CAMPEP_0119376840 /NCGR_PEP_ID=MMETSP1334-20130426/41592_1 /TAXON_ID=127549 /ORGANISM="Calcidiscus leptoporus, Strain RCC1130" /LENGTH=263 /DNA_ID=CAMNT_0007395533 /DNA_START=97 /DNA_END=888 /DNA_ORIENTATION=-
MSAFAALTGIDGDTDVAAAALKKKEDADREAEAEAQAARLRFDELKAKGLTNWADSDEDDDAFFSSAPLAGVSKSAQMGDEVEEEAEASSDEEVGEEEAEGDVDVDADHTGLVGSDGDGNGVITAPAFEVQQSRRKKAPKKEEEEIDSLLAELDVAKNKENPHGEGLSKAALKRAKKKAQQAHEVDAQVTEVPAVAEEEEGGETAAKSAEEVRQMMKARAEAAKKKKKPAASAAIAAAEAASKARGGKPKTKRDKSHYNQQPA